MGRAIKIILSVGIVIVVASYLLIGMLLLDSLDKKVSELQTQTMDLQRKKDETINQTISLQAVKTDLANQLALETELIRQQELQKNLTSLKDAERVKFLAEQAAIQAAADKAAADQAAVQAAQAAALRQQQLLAQQQQVKKQTTTTTTTKRVTRAS